jgi:uncharacterized membrane protein YbaN (DUF454 family)
MYKDNFGKKLILTFLMYCAIGYTISVYLVDMFWTSVAINTLVFYCTWKIVNIVWSDEEEELDNPRDLE